MRRLIGCAALLLGGIGVLACLAGLIGIWIVRPTALRASAEVLESAADALQLVEEKTARAGELVQKVRGSVDPLDSMIRELTDKSKRTPDQDKELRRIQDEVAERLRQLDAIAEAVETAVTLLNKTSRLTSALRGGSERKESGTESVGAYSGLAKKLGALRAILAKFRDDKEFRKEIIDDVVRTVREVNDDLKAVDSQLQTVRGRASSWKTEIDELRPSVSAWTNWVAIIGSAVLAWLGLGQYALARWGWGRIRKSPTKPAASPEQ